jgi:23S rRNA pseudouridine2605 synthase
MMKRTDKPSGNPVEKKSLKEKKHTAKKNSSLTERDSSTKAVPESKKSPARKGSKSIEVPETEKLQKLLARAGFGSRRELETWLAEGRVTINGKLAVLGDRAALTDRICVDGKPVSMQRLEGPRVRVLLYNKPIGEICTRSDPEGRPTIFERLPPLEKGRWIAVGRLDLNTSGLLIITSDGELANKLMHPSAQIDREYLVRVMGAVDNEMLQRLRDGVDLDDGIAKFTDVAPMHKDDSDSINRWYCCTLMEGRNREVRRLWESQGLKVSRLKRVRFGPVFLANKLPEGRWQELTPGELAILYQEAGLPVPKISELTPQDKQQLRREQRKPMRGRVGERTSARTVESGPRRKK